MAIVTKSAGGVVIYLGTGRPFGVDQSAAWGETRGYKDCPQASVVAIV